MNKIKNLLFYTLSFTWGFIMSFIGIIVMIVLMISGKKPHLFHRVAYIEVGESWGGFEIGPFFVCNTNPSKHLKQHESGHGIQNILFGPLMPFLVCLPSTARYWLRESLYAGKYKIFTAVLISILALFIALTAVSYVFFPMWVGIVSLIATLYVLIICLWIFFIERPQYNIDLGIWPDYDEVWFEGMATKLGEKYYK